VSSRSKGKYALFFCLKPEFTQKNLRYHKPCDFNGLRADSDLLPLGEITPI